VSLSTHNGFAHVTPAMRRLWWAIVLTAVTAGALAFAFFRHRQGDFVILRPYVFSEEHKYYEPTRRTPDDQDYYEIVHLRARGLPPKFENAFLAELKGDGWQAGSGDPTSFYKGRNEDDASKVTVILMPDPESDFTQNSLWLQEYRSMSPLEVWYLRVRHLGSDPFSHD
jgi:hypothetical protein